MKKWFALLMLAALLLALACAALAEEEPVAEDEMLGVWQAVDNENLQLLILPGIYAPLPRAAKLPELFACGLWQESPEKRIEYMMQVNKRKPEENSLLSSLLGNAVAKAFRTIENKNDYENDSDLFDAYEYTHASIGVLWTYGQDESEYYDFTSDASGIFYAFRAEDGSVMLYWMDDYDPHASCTELYRITVDTPSDEALAQNVLRPVIDVAEGAEAQTALSIIRWASESRCMRMNSAALTDNLRAAFAALEPVEAQTFRDNYAKISGMMLDAMGLNPENWSMEERYKPFKDAGLQDAVTALGKETENQRAVDVLNAAIDAVMG